MQVGQTIKARAIKVDLERKRLALSCKTESEVKSSGKQKLRKNSSRKSKSKDSMNEDNPFATLKKLNL